MFPVVTFSSQSSTALRQCRSTQLRVYRLSTSGGSARVVMLIQTQTRCLISLTDRVEEAKSAGWLLINCDATAHKRAYLYNDNRSATLPAWPLHGDNPSVGAPGIPSVLPHN